MLIVISDHQLYLRESAEINRLFESGMELYHIRHHNISEEDLRGLIAGVESDYLPRVVANHNHDIARSMGIQRFHFTEEDRKKWEKKKWKNRSESEIYSTSVHSLETFNELPDFFEYAFISPVFDSISKPGCKAVRFDLSQRNSEKPIKLIGLGGIHSANIHDAMDLGYDGFAVLGSIWESEEPVKAFQKIRNAMESKIEV
jgi:thiamine-phosphate pyrophosphorylase